jgi:hypothetical protein
MRVPYALVCTLLGLLAGWLPWLVHGPIPAKLDVLYINGRLYVWGYYVARILIGFMVGVTTWPDRWYARGPLVGFLMLLPLAIIALATPTCGARCMGVNLISATVVGTLIAGAAYAVTGKHHR